jgi:RNA ligase
MTAALHDLFDPSELSALLDSGRIRVSRHHELDLCILNYSATVQYERFWTPATRACRGLIVDGDGQVRARPWPKFFNLGEPEAEAGAGPVDVTDKMDGSLGILYPTPDGPAVATRGSFVSEQALHATELLRTRYRSFDPNPVWTYLYEIIYPGNRIVVDYGGMDDLVLLGAVDTTTGRSVAHHHAVEGWPGPVVERFHHETLTQALAAPERPNREGVVIHFTHSDTRIKVKYPDYLRLHRLVTGLSTKAVFEHLKSGKPLDELLGVAPDELFPAIHAVAGPLQEGYDTLVGQIKAYYAQVCDRAHPAVDRKAFAQAVLALDFPLRHTLFELADTGRVNPDKIWEHLRPAFYPLGQLGRDPIRSPAES